MTPKRHHVLIFILVLVIIAALFYFVHPPKSVAPDGQVATTTSATSSVAYTTKTITENNSQYFYSLKASYPVFKLSNQSVTASINRGILDLVNQELTSYRSSFDTSGGPTASAGEYGTSTFELAYTVITNSRLNRILPIRFDENTYSAGAAHPGSNILTLNYNLATGENISLANIFKPDSQYLEAISAYAVPALEQKLGSDADPTTIETGAGPMEENFRDFLITDSGLEIIFNEYQVAAYAAGEEDVTIPWSNLRDILNPNLNLI